MQSTKKVVAWYVTSYCTLLVRRKWQQRPPKCCSLHHAEDVW